MLLPGTIRDTYSTTVENKEHPSIPACFFDCVHSRPNDILYEFPNDAGIWQRRTYVESAKRIAAISQFLKNIGVSKGDHVAIVSGTRPEWVEIDLAILSLGAVTVSVYPSLTAPEAGFVLFDADISIIFIENQEQLDKIQWLLDHEIDIPARDDTPETKTKLQLKKLISIEVTSSHPLLRSLSSILSEFEDAPLPQIPSEINHNSLASIVYTSGTTGAPKGVLQTHGNHLANVEQASVSGIFGADSSLFLFLPLAHSFAKLIAYIGFLTPALIKFSGVADKKSSKVDLARVAGEMKESDAEVIPSVPRVFEKIRDTLEARAQMRSLQGKILHAAISNARGCFQKSKDKKPISLWEQILHAALTPIRNKVKRSLFGPHFSHAISGGAKLPLEVTEFFWSLGIEIYEGYGLTETCVATNVNLKNKRKLGSVGPAFIKVETKIAEDGEILFRGPNITKGYLNRPKATAESWDAEGWFHTGDVGHIDDEGFLFITDRKKELIITAGGKKVPPQKIENLLTRYSLINQALYCGDGKPYCVALVTLNHAMTKHMKEDEVQTRLNEIKDSINKELASYEAIKKIKALPGEFTIDNGLLTPTLKMKRKVILNEFQKEYESLY